MNTHMIAISPQIKKPRMYIRGCARRGFSFAEVMFAVVILGIGFIMVAAIFPVAIQQTQMTGEENIAAALARQAASSISQLPSTLTNPIQSPVYYPNPNPVLVPPTLPVIVSKEFLFPPTVKNYVPGNDPSGNAVAPPAIVVPLLGNRWDMVKSNVILPSDPRYAYVAFYKRENNTFAAQLIVVAVAIRNRSVYDTTKDLSNYLTNTLPTTPNATITSTKSGNFPPQQAQTIICPDTLVTSSAAQEGYYFEIPATAASPAPVGRSYTLGSYAGTGWELTPGDSMALGPGTKGWGTAGQVVDTACANQSAYLNPPATLQPTVAYAQMYTSATAPFGQIVLSLTSDMATTNVAPPVGPPAQGAFVIIADDFPLVQTVVPFEGGPALPDYLLPKNIPGASGFAIGSLNGHIFRLGAPVPVNASANPPIGPGTFNLDPAYGMRPASGGFTSPDTIPNTAMMQAAGMSWPASGMCAKVYIIGAGRTDPTVTSGSNATYTGSAQDIGIFTTYFQVQ